MIISKDQRNLNVTERLFDAKYLQSLLWLEATTFANIQRGYLWPQRGYLWP